MLNDDRDHSRRAFLERLGAVGASAALGAAPAPPPQTGSWDLTWIDRVQRARHRALFDAPMGGIVLDLATRYLDNLRTVYGAFPANEVCAVINLRTRAVSMALGDAIWQKYPLAEDYKVDDPRTKAPARRNVNWTVEPDAYPGTGSLSALLDRNSVILVCDFALGHLATRLSKTPAAGGAKADAVHAELRSGLVRGAVLVPSGIFGGAVAQNAGCAFIPA